MAQKIIVVSNRLPVQAHFESGTWSFTPTAGGLASALSGLRPTLKFDWVGWPGTTVENLEHGPVRSQLREEFHYHPVFLEENEVEDYYNGFSNRVLWPLFHYMPNRIEFSDKQWLEYQKVNEKFAEAVLQICDDDSLVWIHDFHLMLLPKILREKKPSLKIGFFLHIPFPSSEIYRLLPVRKEILQGVLGADVVGFHTHDYGRHFSTSCLRILGIETEYSEIMCDDRSVTIDCYPIGINPIEYQERVAQPQIAQRVDELKQTYLGKRIILGVDRIDYIKGLPLKFRAFERFLEQNPHERERAVLIQVAVPSRDSVDDYRELKRELDELVGRINGRFGSVGHTPIHYITRNLGGDELCALYKVADVMLITSVRDGMNLVSFEYSYCKEGKDGMLVISEFAGAAHIFSEGLVVNPWDLDGVAAALARAFTIDPNEVTRRAARNFSLTNEFSSMSWSQRFLGDLQQASRRPFVARHDLSKHFIQLQKEYNLATRRHLFFDYDGTLVSIQERPESAVPSKHLLGLLEDLTADERNLVTVISGRTTAELEKWFGKIEKLRLAGEHGLFFRANAAKPWQELFHVSSEWKAIVRPILEDFVRRTPGTFVEEKRAGLAWHYRLAAPDFAEWSSYELTLHLEETLKNVPVEVIRGKKVIEVRSVGANKGSLVSRFFEHRAPQSGDLVLCIGDDRTDEDMFAVMPESAWTCRVGSRRSRARYFLQDPREVTLVIEALVRNY